jgi:phage repressor protein C with HTH and peptisase S24 domain
MAETHLSAGGGAFVISEGFKDLYAFRKDWLRRIATATANLILMRIMGDSMEPTIKDGDMVMIDKGRTRILSGMIYAIGVNDTINIKRVEAMSGGLVRIISDNREEYPSYEHPTDQIRILGQVVWFARQLVREE